MTINVTRDPCTGDYLLRGTLSAVEFMAAQGPAEIVNKAMQLAATQLAEQFVAVHGIDVLAKMDATAVANLAVAQSGAAIRESLEKQIPKEVQHHHHYDREVYQAGIFGGLRRVR